MFNTPSHIEHVVVDELFEYDIPSGVSKAEQITQPPHGAWTYGTAHISGSNFSLHTLQNTTYTVLYVCMYVRMYIYNTYILCICMHVCTSAEMINRLID